MTKLNVYEMRLIFVEIIDVIKFLRVIHKVIINNCILDPLEFTNTDIQFQKNRMSIPVI